MWNTFTQMGLHRVMETGARQSLRWLRHLHLPSGDITGMTVDAAQVFRFWAA